MTNTPAPLTRARIVGVSRDDEHRFSKTPQAEITVVAGLGVEGDAHAGVTVQHLWNVRHDPSEPNLRQVHLMHSELFDELVADGFEVVPGALGENVTTTGIDLLALPRGTRLRLGEHAEVELTGLRNPCTQINGIAPKLMQRLVRRDAADEVTRLSGVMSIAITGGVVRPGDTITVTLPDGEHETLPVV